MGEAKNREGKGQEGVYIVIESDETKGPKQRYKIRSIKIMSILHLVLGLTAVGVEVAKWIARSENNRGFCIWEGLYCGLVFVVTGSLGLSSARKTSSCSISAFLVFSILSAIFGAFLFLTSTILMVSARVQDTSSLVCLYWTLILVGLIELVLGIVSSGFSCHACCGCCAGGESTGTGGNSVVFISPQEGTKEEGDGGKPRVVHLNLAELRKQKEGGRQLVLKEQEKPEEGEITCESGKYSRFT